jgi:dihydropteroate synthase
MSQISSRLPIVWTSGGKSLQLDVPRVMGILNLTPDSFFDGGKYALSEAVAVNRVKEMVREGVDIVDIGAASSKPGAPIIDPQEEQKRLLPFLKAIRRTFPDLWISVDTYHSSTAEKSLELGADMINDISAASIDAELVHVVAKFQCPYILMHMQETPSTMQEQPSYGNVVDEVISFFRQKMVTFSTQQVQQIALDPGFGFGKTVEHNFELLKHMQQIRKEFKLPMLAGISRKSMINKVIHVSPEEALNGTTALHMLALQNGADILRTHDVKEAKQTILLFQKYQITS